MAETPFFIQQKSIPFWAAGILTVIILAWVYADFLEMTDENQARLFLNTNAGLLVTTLAITMSFALLAIRFLAEAYSPRALIGYLKDKIVYGFLSIYIVLISMNLVSSGIPSIISPAKFLPFAVLGTIFSLLYLIAFIYHMTYSILPESVIKGVSKNLQSQTREEIINNRGVFYVSSRSMRPFIILQQTLVRAINNNDIFSFTDGLALLFLRLSQYLLETEKAIRIDSGESKLSLDRSYIYRFFFNVLSPLVTECISQRREQFLVQYMSHMFTGIRIVYNNKNTREANDFWEEIQYLGNRVIDLEMLSAARIFLRQLENLMLVEMEVLRKIESTRSKDAMGTRSFSRESINGMVVSYEFTSYRLRTLTDFAITASIKKMGSLVNLSNATLNKMLEKAIQIRDGRTRRSVSNSIIESFRKIHEVSTDNGMHNTVWSTGWLENFVKKMDKRYINEAKHLTESLCELSLYSIEKEFYYEISELGSNGRLLVDEFPDIVIIILNTLEKAWKIVSQNPHHSSESELEKIIDEIKSIEKWNKKNHQSVKTRIDGILKNLL